MNDPKIRINRAHDGVRIQSAGGNGEPLETSEVLESREAVRVHIAIMRKTWSGTDEEILLRLQNRTGNHHFEPMMDLVKD